MSTRGGGRFFLAVAHRRRRSIWPLDVERDAWVGYSQENIAAPEIYIVVYGANCGLDERGNLAVCGLGTVSGKPRQSSEPSFDFRSPAGQRCRKSKQNSRQVASRHGRRHRAASRNASVSL